MKKLWLLAIPALLVLAIGGPGCGRSQEAPKPPMEQKAEKVAPAPMMEEAKEMAEEAAPPVMEKAPEATEDAKAEGGALLDTMKEKAVGEANKAMEDMETE